MRDTTTRDRLITSAAQVLHERSYGSVGVDELCEHAGVRKGSFYYFFASKRDLALAVLEAQWDGFERQALRPAREAERPLDRIAMVFDYAVATLERARKTTGCVLGCPFGNLAVELSNIEPEIRVKIAEIFGRLARFFEDALGAAVVAGDIGEIDVPRAASALVAYYEGVLLLGKTAGQTQVMRALVPGALLLTALGGDGRNTTVRAAKRSPARRGAQAPRKG
jgi:TetR/AcrR family transcriptional repressor of nem operon